MRLLAIAVDYDGTLASDGKVDDPTVVALERWKSAGNKLILNTGREFQDLLGVFPHARTFDCIVAENGGLLYSPEHDEMRILAPPPPAACIERLQASGIEPLSIGNVVIATKMNHGNEVAAIIRELGLELEVTVNRDAIMVLPKGVDKASGLIAASHQLKIDIMQMAGIGDAENDIPFLKICGLSIAVANALPAVKAMTQWITKAETGAGVTEAIVRLLDQNYSIATSK